MCVEYTQAYVALGDRMPNGRHCLAMVETRNFYMRFQYFRCRRRKCRIVGAASYRKSGGLEHFTCLDLLGGFAWERLLSRRSELANKCYLRKLKPMAWWQLESRRTCRRTDGRLWLRARQGGEGLLRPRPLSLRKLTVRAYA